MMKARAIMLAGVAIVALVGPAEAASRHKRAYSETGPLIMSGTMVPPAMARRSRAPAVCRPVTVKRRPMLSTLISGR